MENKTERLVERVLSENPDLLVACARGMEELKRQRADAEGTEKWEWLHDTLVISFDPLHAFLTELESKVPDEDYPFSTGGRMILKSALERVGEVVEALERDFGKMKVYFEEVMRTDFRFSMPISKIELHDKNSKNPAVTTRNATGKDAGAPAHPPAATPEAERRPPMFEKTEVRTLSEEMANAVYSKTIPLLAYIEQLLETQDESYRGVGEVLEVLYNDAMAKIEKEFKEIEKKVGRIEATYSTAYHPDMEPGVVLDVQFTPAEHTGDRAEKKEPERKRVSEKESSEIREYQAKAALLEQSRRETEDL